MPTRGHKACFNWALFQVPLLPDMFPDHIQPVGSAEAHPCLHLLCELSEWILFREMYHVLNQFKTTSFWVIIFCLRQLNIDTCILISITGLLPR